MLADLALEQAGDDLIGASIGRGLMIIYRDGVGSGNNNVHLALWRMLMGDTTVELYL
jgi:hypothetical protein